MVRLLKLNEGIVWGVPKLSFWVSHNEIKPHTYKTFLEKTNMYILMVG